MKYFKLSHIYFLPFLAACWLYSCSSGDYEIDEYSVEKTEETLKIDTLGRLDTMTVVRERQEITKPEKFSYVIQIGAYLMKSNYENFIARARQMLGSDVYDVYMNDLYKVRIGKFTNRDDAVNFLEKVRNLGFYDAFVITTRQ